MTEEEARAVSAALAETGSARLAMLSAFATAEQLHQFALKFNANEEPAVCLAVVEHELCDHGTAVFMFWRFVDLILFSDRASDAQAVNQTAKRALSAIRHILDTRTFQSASIAYSALDDLQLNALQRRKLAALALPDHMLRCSGK